MTGVSQMPDTPTSTSIPNQQLAEQIVAKLASEQLIVAAKHREVLEKLAKGTASESDWKLWLDLPLMKKEAGR